MFFWKTFGLPGPDTFSPNNLQKHWTKQEWWQTKDLSELCSVSYTVASVSFARETLPGAQEWLLVSFKSQLDGRHLLKRLSLIKESKGLQACHNCFLGKYYAPRPTSNTVVLQGLSVSCVSYLAIYHFIPTVLICISTHMDTKSS